MKIKNPNTGEIIEVPKGMENAVREAIESGNNPLDVMKYGGIHIKKSKKRMNMYADGGKVVSEIWQEVTGMPWSEAKKLGLTKGSYDDNIKLREELLYNPEKFAGLSKSIKSVSSMTPKQKELLAIQNLISDYNGPYAGTVPNTKPSFIPKNPLNLFAPYQELLSKYNEQPVFPGQSVPIMPYKNGGGIDNPGFRALPDYVQQNILDNMAYGGYMASGGCMECGGMMETGGKIPTEVLRSRLEAHMSPNEVEDYLDSYAMGGSIPEAKNGKWIQKAINPKHKGYCTPMTKSTCTPKRKALALTLKKMAKSRKKEEGGYVEGKEYEMTDSEIARLRAMGYKISEL